MLRLCNKMAIRIRPRLVIADWDETITSHDTISLVAQAAYLAKPQYQPPFQHFTNVYLEAYKEYNKQFEEDQGPRNSIEREILYQNGMRAVEMASIDEIERLKLFQGITKAQFRDQASKVDLRPGFIEFLGLCHKNEVPVVILSINWTKLLIEECLKRHGFKESSSLQIIVNGFEFESVESGETTTGNWHKEVSVRTAIDKLEIVKRLRAECGSTLYVGDSSTDLLGMLESDTGVVMKGGSVIKQLDGLGLQYKTSLQEWDENTRLYVADWNELAMVF